MCIRDSSNKVAAVDGPRRITFAEFNADAQAFAHALIADHVAEGDRVGILASNSYEALLAQFAVPLARAVTVPINTRLAPAEVNHILDHASIDVLIGEKELIDPILDSGERDLRRAVYIADKEGVEPQVERADTDPQGASLEKTFSAYLAGHRDEEPLPYRVRDENETIAINYTSGTTGKPKGVIYTHRGAYLNALGQAHTQHFNHDTVYLWTLPMFHCSGWCLSLIHI